MVKLNIISDPVCPWCYIGKTYLDRALEQFPDHSFEIEWYPFQLNPDMPKAGMDRREYLETKFGGKDGALRAYAPILQRAEATGLKIDFAGIKTTPNTLDAHRLIHWAGLEGCQTAAVSSLFRAYFNEGRDIGALEVLIEIAVSIGMDADMVRRLLETDADIRDTQTRDKNARERGVTGVPTFIIANQHVLAGAQPTELWVQVINDFAEQLKDT